MISDTPKNGSPHVVRRGQHLKAVPDRGTMRRNLEPGGIVRMQFQAILEDIVATLTPELGAEGDVAHYIPALARVPVRRLGMALCTRHGDQAQAGDGTRAFSIQSISKLFTLTMAMDLVGESLWRRIGREPSGNPFNSLVQLERENGVPRNPFINAGAIAIADRLRSFGIGIDDVKRFVSDLAGAPLEVDEEVAASEAGTGDRNRALAYFMKSFGKIDNAVDSVLDLYFHQCALRMSCEQLARATQFLCHDGQHLGETAPRQVLTSRQTRRVNALMLTCGTYDAAGEFAYQVGLPCKSGVGGGIVAVLPEELTLCVWSPALDANGNSILGRRALEMFVAKTGLSVF